VYMQFFICVHTENAEGSAPDPSATVFVSNVTPSTGFAMAQASPRGGPCLIRDSLYGIYCGQSTLKQGFLRARWFPIGIIIPSVLSSSKADK
jgi:hypothetical protein